MRKSFFFLLRYTGLRQMADLVNRNVTYWWRTDYADLANVYLLQDYVVASDLVQVAIERNLELAKRKRELERHYLLDNEIW